MWTLKTIEADVAEVGQALDDAVSTYKADAGDTVAHRAVDAAATFAKSLVAEGLFGDRVQVVATGHANPEPSADGSVAPDQVTVQVRAIPPVPVAEVPSPAEAPSEGTDPSEPDSGSGRSGRASRAARSSEEG